MTESMQLRALIQRCIAQGWHATVPKLCRDMPQLTQAEIEERVIALLRRGELTLVPTKGYITVKNVELEEPAVKPSTLDRMIALFGPNPRILEHE